MLEDAERFARAIKRKDITIGYITRMIQHNQLLGGVPFGGKYPIQLAIEYGRADIFDLLLPITDPDLVAKHDLLQSISLVPCPETRDAMLVSLEENSPLWDRSVVEDHVKPERTIKINRIKSLYQQGQLNAVVCESSCVINEMTELALVSTNDYMQLIHVVYLLGASFYRLRRYFDAAIVLGELSEIFNIMKIKFNDKESENDIARMEAVVGCTQGVIDNCERSASNTEVLFYAINSRNPSLFFKQIVDQSASLVGADVHNVSMDCNNGNH